MVRRKVALQLHRQDLAEHRARRHDARVREVHLGLAEEVGAHDEARVDHGEVLKARILEHDGADDGKVDVGRGELSRRG